MSSELYLSIGDGKSPQHDSLVTVPTRLEIKASPAMHRSLRAHVEQVCDVSLIDEPMTAQMDVVGHVVMGRADHKMHSQPLHIHESPVRGIRIVLTFFALLDKTPCVFANTICVCVEFSHHKTSRLSRRRKVKHATDVFCWLFAKKTFQRRQCDATDCGKIASSCTFWS